MLYDNGQLASTYLDAFCLTGKASYARVTRGILDYLRRDMTHPDGGIFSAEVRPPVFSSQDSLLYVSEHWSHLAGLRAQMIRWGERTSPQSYKPCWPHLGGCG